MGARVGVLALFIAMLGAVFAVDINGCTEISDPGDYDLVANLVGANVSVYVPYYGDVPVCIVITSSDVTLDCHSRTITGSNGRSVGIVALGGEGALRGITIMDCAVSRYDSGIVAYRMADSSLTGNNVHDSALWGIRLDSSDRNNLTDNRAYDNGADGILLLMSSYNTLENNRAYSNTNGIYIYTEAMQDSYNALRENEAYDNSNSGIVIVEDSYNELYSNRVHGNPIGIDIVNSDGDELNGDHFYDNDVDFIIESVGGVGIFDVSLTDVIFDSSAGNFASYTNLSLTDSVEGGNSYSITWVSPPTLPDNYSLFRGKAIDIVPNIGDVSIDEIYWQWTDNELSGYSYENISLWHHNGQDWELVSDAPDFHYIMVSDLSDFSPFALFYPGANESDDDDDDGGGDQNMSLSFSSTCDGNIVTVTSGDSHVAEATVRVDGQTAGVTGANGHVVFEGCGRNVSITATKSGYHTATLNASLIDCLQCQDCLIDSDCPDDQYCSQGDCVPLNCTCGYVLDHQCHEYACCSDSDCSTGQSCANHSCVIRTEPESGCKSDDDCLSEEYCDIPTGASSGDCRNVTGECGYPYDHAWTNYECGPEASCKQCQPGYICSKRKCVLYDLSCPSTGIVGNVQLCAATEDDKPCANCDYRIAGPDGTRSAGKTSQSGSISFTPQSAGTYRIALLKNGTLIEEVGMEAVSGANVVDITKPKALIDEALCLPLFLLALLAIAIYWWLSRRKKPEEEQLEDEPAADAPPMQPKQEKPKEAAPPRKKRK